uniref:Myoferlin like n=1 Tax=Gasterosteus aculeatus aculeatus TaxID=481459 RepID=A0AAQ4PUW1_GASAC
MSNLIDKRLMWMQFLSTQINQWYLFINEPGKCPHCWFSCLTASFNVQIRVRVIEGRQLPGNNIKPVVKVNVCGQTHRTRIRRGNNPFFNEVSLQKNPIEKLFDESISLLIIYILLYCGCLNMLNIIQCPGHAIMRKWLLLSDPDDSSSGARGYLKVSITVVGTGDDPPVCVSSFLPTSLLLLDTEYISILKETTTSYPILSSAQTERKEMSEEHDDIESNLLVPAGSIYYFRCRHWLQFTCMTICTLHCDAFQGQGVAYRGRVLVELSTQLDEKVDKNVDDISSDDILKYQRRRKFSLCAVFHSACMLQEPGEPIQFEVSIGNYGNKLDSTCKPLSSTTQYSFAVFDGNHYYYLPWADTKPVVIVTSHWEDISHRLDSVNILLFIAERLVITSYSCTYCLSLHRYFQLPGLEGQPHVTALDLQLKKLRDAAVDSIREMMANRMREGPTDVKATVEDIEDWLDRIKQLPQNSMPDVIIWMLRGEKRVAFARVPANQILFSNYSEQACGKHCGRTQTIFMQVPVQLRINIWLCLSVHEKKFNSFSDGNFSVYAEMYENQAHVLGKWGTTGLVGRHKFSNVTGKVKLKRERFLPPRGWDWEDEWFVDPERCLLTEADAGHTEFTDEVFHNETRFPGGEWKAAVEPYTDVNGETAQDPKDFECPTGWCWEDDWSFDSDKAVDEKGWEYGVTIPPDDKPKSWVAVEKMYHVHRRKRLIRPRKKISDKTAVTEVRKRRQRVALRDVMSEISQNFARLLPYTRSETQGRFLQFTVEHLPSEFYRYHLRVYVYQARNLSSQIHMFGLTFPSDPYAHVSFLHVSKTTEVVRFTLNPLWDQTLIFEDIEIYGDPQTIARNPPDVVLELCDKDQVGKDEPLGRCTCPPVVTLNPSTAASPKLLWLPVTKKGRSAGEILLAAELFQKNKETDGDLPLVPPRRGEKLYMVPQGIRPVVQLTAIEVHHHVVLLAHIDYTRPAQPKNFCCGCIVLTWGLRNMTTYQLATVSSPSLIVECGGEVVETAVVKNIKKNPNFPGSVLLLKVLLPKEEMYTPPIVLKVIDHRPFGRKPVVGQCTIDRLEEFRCDPYCINSEVGMSARGIYKNCMHIQYMHIQLHTVETHCIPELEEVAQFQGLNDFCSTFKLQRGKTEYDEDDPSVVGEFKGSFKIYPLPDDPGVPAPPRQFRELPESGPQECLVRIYVVRCLDLQPKDTNGMCDPYVKISLGRKKLDDRDNYKPNTLDPEFGRMFELSCFLPQDKDLKIAVYDYDLLSRDEKVGETVIDLENRLLSRFRAGCGLPKTYCVSGINQWRDQLKPSEIFHNVARVRGVNPPLIEGDGSSLSFAGKLYNLQDFEANTVIHPHLGPARERLALHVLRTQALVPEHVETRSLCSSHQPNLSQGKIQMWVDIFPKSLGLPGPPWDITPRKAKKYVLRAIIWNTTDVTLDERSITGEDMSDIYVKGYFSGMEDHKQQTDVHYRSLDGDGNFNWRFIFGFDYLPAEQMCVVSKKEHIWNLDKTELRIPPKLIIQIWDNDKFSLDDYLGTVELDLLNLIPPAKSSEKCSLKMLPGREGSVASKKPLPNSLFSQKSVRGWWPCTVEQDGKHVLGGKVEMTLEIVEEKEMEERPAGKGRDEPNMNPRLDPPKRPDTSFFWFTNPCKTMKFIVWRRFKWIFIGAIFLLLVILFLGILLYSLPATPGPLRSHSLVAVAVCFGSLSCWKTQLLASRSRDTRPHPSSPQYGAVGLSPLQKSIPKE